MCFVCCFVCVCVWGGAFLVCVGVAVFGLLRCVSRFGVLFLVCACGSLLGGLCLWLLFCVLVCDFCFVAWVVGFVVRVFLSCSVFVCLFFLLGLILLSGVRCVASLCVVLCCVLCS